MLQVVAGLTLKSLSPRVWDATSPYYLPTLKAVMISYSDFHRVALHRRTAMNQGLHTYLGVPDHMNVYLDNGAFALLKKEGETPRLAYEEFVLHANPNWWPIPQDFIPTASMTPEQQLACFQRTTEMNLAYQHDGYTPVIHISPYLLQYTSVLKAHQQLAAKPTLALGGIVPNLLRAPKAIPYHEVLKGLIHVRDEFHDKRLHVFGIGGNATLHLAALLGIDSVDSSGWRNRAARGIIQLPGSGDRTVADLGSWRGRKPNARELEVLAACQCPTCRQSGLQGLQAGGVTGFNNRATHNLWVLLEEAQLIEEHLAAGTYASWYLNHLDNTIYRPLIDQLLELRRLKSV